MEIHVTEAKSGAIRQSWSRDSIRAVFAQIKAARPKANHTILVKLLAERMAEDDDARLAAADYIVTNFLVSEVGYTKRQEYKPRTREQFAKEVAATSQSIQSQILLLNQEMPNGKRMRYCTGTQMAHFGRGYQRIAKKAGAKMVGSVLNENEVRNLMMD